MESEVPVRGNRMRKRTKLTVATLLAVAFFSVFNIINIRGMQGDMPGDPSEAIAGEPSPSPSAAPSPAEGGDPEESGRLFKDVNDRQWFYPYIQQAVRSGLVTKKPESAYYPESQISSAEFIRLLLRASGYKAEENDPSGKLAFSQAVALKLLDKKDAFSASRPVTRKQAASLVSRFAGFLSGVGQRVLEDTADPGANALCREYILRPFPFKGKRYFKPDRELTRAEAVALIVRACEYKNAPGSFKAREKAGERKEVRLPILMYHEITTDPKQLGKIAVTPDEFTGAMELLRTEGFHPVTFGDLLAFTNGFAGLPGKPVIVTFDDGYKDNYDYAFSIMKSLEMKFVINLVGNHLSREWNDFDSLSPNKHLSVQNILEMYQSGWVEFQNHTFNLHSWTGEYYGSVINPYRGEGSQEYGSRLLDDFIRNNGVIEFLLGYRPRVLAYPMGMYTAVSEAAGKKAGFDITLLTREGINNLGEGLYLMKRINVPHGMKMEDLRKKLHE